MLTLLTLTLLLTVSLQMEIKVIRLPGESSVLPGGPAPCALTCSGTEEINNWEDRDGKSVIKVNNDECGFVSTPIVTVSVESWSPAKCPPVTIETYRNPNYFRVHTTELRTASQMIADRCRLNWSAFGFSC